MERLVGAHAPPDEPSTTVARPVLATPPRSAALRRCACDARSAAAGGGRRRGDQLARRRRLPPPPPAAARARRRLGGEGAAPLPHELNERRDGVARRGRAGSARRPELGHTHSSQLGASADVARHGRATRTRAGLRGRPHVRRHSGAGSNGARSNGAGGAPSDARRGGGLPRCITGGRPSSSAPSARSGCFALMYGSNDSTYERSSRAACSASVIAWPHLQRGGRARGVGAGELPPAAPEGARPHISRTT